VLRRRREPPSRHWILQAALCVEQLMGGAERERLGNDMHAQVAEHDLQRKLGFRATGQPE